MPVGVEAPRPCEHSIDLFLREQLVVFFSLLLNFCREREDLHRVPFGRRTFHLLRV
jgi:hypothetical protein